MLHPPHPPHKKGGYDGLALSHFEASDSIGLEIRLDVFGEQGRLTRTVCVRRCSGLLHRLLPGYDKHPLFQIEGRSVS